MGAIDAVEWACVLCGCHIQNGWASRAMNLHQISHEAWTFLPRNYPVDSEGHSYGQLVTGSFVMTTGPLMHRFVQFFCETSNRPGDSAPLLPRFGARRLLAFPKIKITFEREEIFRPLMRFRNVSWGSWWRLGELCEVPRCLLWRGLRHHCPMNNVSCILYLLQEMSLFFILHGWIPSGQTSYVTHY